MNKADLWRAKVADLKKFVQGSLKQLKKDRDNSADSTYFGFVERGAIRGRAVSISDSDDKTRVGKAIK
jgi:type IV secretory pathway protease TraF